MTRQECEKAIFDKMVEIKKLYHEYNPDGTYLTLAYTNDTLMFNNQYFGEDCDKPIDCFVDGNSETYEVFPKPYIPSEDDYMSDPEAWAQEFVDSCEQFLSDDRVIREMEESDEAMAL